ncbi:MAG: SMI1/KNR4 family protein [Fimbriimonadaceae bacterium]
MDALAALELLKKATWVNEDDELMTADFKPGLSESEIQEIERRIGARMPEDYRLLLAHVTELCGPAPGPEMDFSGRTCAFEMLELFPRGLPFAFDGCGNFWVVDVLSEPEAKAAIFYVCHDAPVMLFQCFGVAAFLADVASGCTPENKCLTIDVNDDKLFNVWNRNPGLLTMEEALVYGDSLVQAFAQTLSPDFLICDLRNAAPGMGFSWGRFGPNTVIRRYGEERIFAYAKPSERSPRPGFLARLFGRR